MPVDDQLSEHRAPVGERSGPDRRHPYHHRHSRRLRKKIKFVLLVAMALIFALFAWYLVVTYLDERALGPTSHRIVQMLRASGLNQ